MKIEYVANANPPTDPLWQPDRDKKAEFTGDCWRICDGGKHLSYKSIDIKDDLKNANEWTLWVELDVCTRKEIPASPNVEVYLQSDDIFYTMQFGRTLKDGNNSLVVAWRTTNATDRKVNVAPFTRCEIRKNSAGDLEIDCGGIVDSEYSYLRQKLKDNQRAYCVSWGDDASGNANKTGFDICVKTIGFETR